VTLFWRSFLLIAALIVVSVLASFQILRVAEREPRARELAQQAVSVVNLTRAALVNADPFRRRELLIEMNEREGIRIYPVTNEEALVALRPDGRLERVAERVRARLGAATRFAAARVSASRSGVLGLTKDAPGRCSPMISISIWLEFAVP